MVTETGSLQRGRLGAAAGDDSLRIGVSGRDAVADCLNVCPRL